MNRRPVPSGASGPESTGLAIRDLAIARAGRDVVRGVSFDVPPGQITALLGPNGAGKSTLVLGLTGVLAPHRGRVLLDDTEVSGKRPDQIRSAGLAAAPEGHRILGDLTVADNLRVAGARLRGSRYRQHLDRVLELFPELATLHDRRAGRLSGGQQQMVAVAQAIIDTPRYLVIDELSLGLAPVVVRRLMPVLREIAESGVGILLIEQFTPVALSLAETVVVMSRGTIRLVEPADRLTENPELLHSAYHLTDGQLP